MKTTKNQTILTDQMEGVLLTIWLDFHLDGTVTKDEESLVTSRKKTIAKLRKDTKEFQRLEVDLVPIYEEVVTHLSELTDAEFDALKQELVAGFEEATAS